MTRDHHEACDAEEIVTLGFLAGRPPNHDDLEVLVAVDEGVDGELKTGTRRALAGRAEAALVCCHLPCCSHSWNSLQTATIVAHLHILYRNQLTAQVYSQPRRVCTRVCLFDKARMTTGCKCKLVKLTMKKVV